MAYKFQSGHAIMSGTLDQEGNLAVLDGAGAIQASLGEDGEISGSGKFELGGTVQLDGVVDNAMVNADSIYYFDATDSKMKKDLATDVRNLFFSAISGQATVAAGGALSLDVSAVTAQTAMTGDVDDADELMISDGGVLKRVDFSVFRDAVYNDVSGDATVAAGGALTIANDAVTPAMIDIFDDSLAATDTHILIADGTDYSSFAMSGDATLTNAGVLAIGAQKVVNAMIADDAVGADELASNAVVNASIAANAAIDMDKLDGGSLAASLTDLADGDLMYAGDITDSNNLKSITFGNLEDAIFGNVSGDATIAAGGALSIGADKVTGVMLAPAVAGVGLAQDGNGNLDVDLNELTAATVSVANDSIAIIDADDSSASKKESIADLVSAMAGTGLTALNGQLSVSDGGAVNALADEDATLTESFNVATVTFTDNRTLTLPASAGLAVGDELHVKIQGLSVGKKATIARAGSQTIDGQTSIFLESPGAAVSLKYVAADTFVIF